LLSLRIVAFLLALHIFNFSIDSKDAHPDHHGEDLSHNDIESIVEFIAEVIFNMPDAFAEHDEKDNEESTLYKYFCFSNLTTPAGHSLKLLSASKFEIRNTSMVITPLVNVSSPPPKS
jgi:hypothetical protein